MRKLFRIAAFGALALSIALLALGCNQESTQSETPASQAPAPAPESGTAEGTAEEPAKARKVGFDVDDTLLFSSPAFDRAFGTEGVKPYSAKFWRLVNEGDRGRSVVKRKAREILEKHRAGGAEIFAITSRHDPGGDGLRDFLFETFGIPRENVFFETKGKAGRIKELGLDVYYGDSDSDISAATEAGAKGVRILRSPKSSYKKKYEPGKYGEEIVEDSED